MKSGLAKRTVGKRPIADIALSCKLSGTPHAAGAPRLADTVPIEKDEDEEKPVPSAWRPTFVAIVEALRERNYQLLGISRVASVDERTAGIIAGQIEAYGGTIAPLPDQSWETSVCRWLSPYWEVLVDLFTVEEGLTDLVLHVMVFEYGEDFEFKPHLVYVP